MPTAVCPSLHNLSYYYDRYLQARSYLAQNPKNADDCVGTRNASIETELDSRIAGILELEIDRSYVVHGDAKLANILFEDGEVKAFVDLDNVMRGSLLEDIADCIRSSCIIDGKLDKASYETLVKGYLSIDSGLVSSDEIRILPRVTEKICFELALRYYTDCLSEHKVFKEKYPGSLLERARRNLAISRYAVEL